MIGLIVIQHSYHKWPRVLDKSHLFQCEYLVVVHHVFYIEFCGKRCICLVYIEEGLAQLLQQSPVRCCKVQLDRRELSHNAHIGNGLQIRIEHHIRFAGADCFDLLVHGLKIDVLRRCLVSFKELIRHALHAVSPQRRNTDLAAHMKSLVYGIGDLEHRCDRDKTIL